MPVFRDPIGTTQKSLDQKRCSLQFWFSFWFFESPWHKKSDSSLKKNTTHVHHLASGNSTQSSYNIAFRGKININQDNQPTV